MSAHTGRAKVVFFVLNDHWFFECKWPSVGFFCFYAAITGIFPTIQQWMKIEEKWIKSARPRTISALRWTRPRPSVSTAPTNFEEFLADNLHTQRKSSLEVELENSVLIWKAVMILVWERDEEREGEQRWSELQMENLISVVSMTVTDETRPWSHPHRTVPVLRSELTQTCLCSVSDFAGSFSEPGSLKFYVNQRQFTSTFRNQLKARHEFKFSKSGVWINGD